MDIRERFRRLSLWNKIGTIGAIASIAGIPLTLILYELQQPGKERPFVTSDNAAFAALHRGNFAKAADQFDRILEKDPTNSRLWEGAAYAHIGKAFPDKLNLNRIWDNYDLEPTILTGSLSVAYSCAQKAMDSVANDDQRARANLVLGLVLELAGYDDYGAQRHGLSPLHYYVNAYKILTSDKFQETLPRKVSAIKYTPYREVSLYALQNRLRKLSSVESCLSVLQFHFKDNPEKVRFLSDECRTIE